MSTKVKNVLIGIAAVIVVAFLLWLSWKLAGILIKLFLTALIFLVLAGTIYYFYRRWRAR